MSRGDFEIKHPSSERILVVVTASDYLASCLPGDRATVVDCQVAC